MLSELLSAAEVSVMQLVITDAKKKNKKKTNVATERLVYVFCSSCLREKVGDTTIPASD